MQKQIASTTNPLIKELAQIAQSKKMRIETGCLLIEGKKLVFELARQDREILILANDMSLIPSSLKNPTILISDAIVQKLSTTQTPDGVFAKVPLPKPSSLKNCTHLLVLDGIADPGNLGTLLRTALAFGFNGCFLLPGCCDLFNDKALRAARGSTFELPYQVGSLSALKKLISENGFTSIAADLTGTPYQKVDSPQKPLLILGSEGQGLSSEVRSLASLITIPMNPKVESLNVSTAGAILMHHFQPQAMK